MEGFADFHAHILPGADHGSDCVKTSLAQLAAAEECGVDTIVATPHFYSFSSSSNDFFQRRSLARERLAQEYGGPVRVVTGAEVFLCEGMQNHPRLFELCVEGTCVMLVEMPPAPWGSRLTETLEELDAAGVYVLLAHIERYPSKDVDRLLDMGFHAQINAQSLRKICFRKRAIELINAGYVTALGSDIHGPDRTYGEYGRAMQELGERGEVLQNRMEKLLAGQRP